MAFNGSGTFSRLYNWVNDAAAGINIRADRSDGELDGFATGLSTAICKDGQTTITANLPMGTFRHTGVGNGVARTDYASVGQLQDRSVGWVAAGGTADVITATYSPAITALTDGMECSFRATGSNVTTTPTFAPNGLTAHTITVRGGSVLQIGEIPAANAEVNLRYNLAGTRWELINPNGVDAAFTGPPGISFGGGSTGITYAANGQIGFYQNVGDRTFFQIYILLTSKGSSTGNAKVTNLPTTTASSTNSFACYSVALQSMASITGHVQAFSNFNATDISFQQLGTGTESNLTDANFTNTSAIFVSGSYKHA